MLSIPCIKDVTEPDEPRATATATANAASSTTANAASSTTANTASNTNVGTANNTSNVTELKVYLNQCW